MRDLEVGIGSRIRDETDPRTVPASIIGVEDLYLDRVRQSTIAPENTQLPTYLSALAIGASNHDRMDWRYVDEAIRSETEVDPKLMRKIHRRARRTIGQRLGGTPRG